jgi:WD40 repeat protein
MKIQLTIVMVVLAYLLLGSCVPINPTEYVITPTEYKITPTESTASPTERIISPKEYTDYLVQLAKNEAARIPFQISPDGKWMLSDSCFNAGDDLFLFDTLDKGKKFQIDLSGVLPETAKTLCGTFWSPDSQSFILLGTIVPPKHAFLLLVDVANPNQPQTYIFEWGYDTFAGIAWSPESSKILIDTDDNQVFILDRKGALLENFFWKKDVFTIAWINESQLAMIRGDQNLWILDLERETEKKIFAFSNEIRIVGYQPENNMLLLLSEADGLVFTTFDLSEMRIVSNYQTDVPSFYFDHTYLFIPAPKSEFSGISAQYTLWIFNWKTLEAINLGDKINAVFYSPVFGGFFYVHHNGMEEELVFLKP